MTSITRDQMETVIDRTPALSYDSVTNDYSGRGMYGKSCFGIDYDTADDLAVFLMRLYEVLGEDVAIDMAENIRLDNMGLGMIAYFPGYSIDEWDEDEGDDDDY